MNKCFSETNFFIKYHKYLPSNQNLNTIWESETSEFIFKNNFATMKRIKWKDQFILIKQIMKIDYIKNEQLLINEISVNTTVKKLKIKGILQYKFCVYSEDQSVYTFFQDADYMGEKLLNENDFIKNFSFKERLKIYYKLANTISQLHSYHYIHENIQPEWLFRKKGESQFLITGFKNTFMKKKKVKIEYNYLSSPEIKNYENVVVSGKHDSYSFAMTIALIELNSQINIRQLKRNMNTSQYFGKKQLNMMKKILLKKIELQNGKSLNRKNVLIQFLRWLKLFFIKQQSISFCVDLLCVLDTSITFNSEERPKIYEIADKLKYLILNYDPRQIIHSKQKNILNILQDLYKDN